MKNITIISLLVFALLLVVTNIVYACFKLENHTLAPFDWPNNASNCWTECYEYLTDRCCDFVMDGKLDCTYQTSDAITFMGTNASCVTGCEGISNICEDPTDNCQGSGTLTYVRLGELSSTECHEPI